VSLKRRGLVDVERKLIGRMTVDGDTSKYILDGDERSELKLSGVCTSIWFIGVLKDSLSRAM
jgi:hypothetical protein